MFGAIGRGEQIYYTLTEEMNKNLLIWGLYSFDTSELSAVFPAVVTLVPTAWHCCASAVSQLCQVLGTVV